MRVIILSSSPTGKVARRFLAVAQEHDLDGEVVGIAAADRLLEQDIVNAIVFPRITPEHNDKVYLLDDLAAAGAHIVNVSNSWRVSRDKWQSAAIFKEDAIPTPRTTLAMPGAIFTLESGFGHQAVYKPLNGTHGEGIMIIRLGDVLPKRPGVLQEYIEVGGKDVRLIVVGERVVAAMQRQSKADDFRANLHQGATASAYKPPEAMQKLAVRAARSLELVVAGVDMLPTEVGGLVIEANPSPGLGIEMYSGIDVAGEIMEAIRQGQV